MIKDFIKPFTRKSALLRMVVLMGVYLLFALPFSSMEFIPGLTNLRPVTALIPIFGIFFGPAGAWSYACGNLAYDALSGNLVISSIGGFIGNFLAVSVFWVLSSKFSKDDCVVGCLRSLLLFALASILASLVVSASVTFWVAFFLEGVDAWSVGLSIFANDLFFFCMPGIGLCILLSTEFNMEPYLPSDFNKSSQLKASA